MWAWSWWEELTETSHTSHLMSPVASVARNSAPFSCNTTTFYAISEIIIGRRDLIGCNSPLQWSRRARQDHKQSNMIHSLHATHHNITYSLRDRQSVHKPIVWLVISVRADCGHLELPEHCLRLHLPGVSAAHQVVLQHGAGREGEVAHLHTEELHRRVLHR